MPNTGCYDEYVRGWDTNEGGVLIDDPRLRARIIPALESEEIRIGSFPRVMAEVQPSMFLDLADVVAVWEEKHIAVARMLLHGVIDIHRTRPVLDRTILEKHKAAKGTLREIYVSGHRVSYSIGVLTRSELDYDVRSMRNGYFPAFSHPGDKAIRVTGCVIYIHSQTG